ncbi:unnamed protein product [Thelazia callipaeda]|uniref:GPI transamidase component PIG-T n=1 Tax=Thelazia callipaeda TaxID=103827 RepID=A0A0N5D7J7_THECL|nr:unnamed protein product [Thelazia callipaeda]
MTFYGLFIFIICFSALICNGLELKKLKKDDTYSEELLIKRLKSEHLLAQFRFVITSDVKSGLDYLLFPRIISEVVTKHHIEEFHMSLTHGSWRLNEWGVPPQPASPSGAELYAWIYGNNTRKSVDERWVSFVNSMNGIFCTSLLDILSTYTAAPQISFSRMGYSNSEVSSEIRYGALSRETIGMMYGLFQTGLSMLLNPIKIYESVFHSMSVHFLHICKDGSVSCGDRRRLELNLNFVSEIDLKSRSLNWSFRSVFGRQLDQKCMVADRDLVLFEIDRKVKMQGHLLQKKNDRVYSVYNISAYSPSDFPLDISAKYNTHLNLPVDDSSTLVTIRSYAAGVDQQSGRLISVLRNGQLVSQRVTYTHVVPWFLRIYYHTISIICRAENVDEGEVLNPKVIRKIFIPGKDRQRPFLLEWDIILPAKSVCEFSWEFDKAFLRVNEYPPDANHGFYIPAPVMSFSAADELWFKNRTVLGNSLVTIYDEILGKETDRSIRMYGEILLILLPVPDFSMPFNVICLVCTAIAMLFGPVHSLTTKIMIPLSEENKDLAPLPPLRRLLVFIYNLVFKQVVMKIWKKSIPKKEKIS